MSKTITKGRAMELLKYGLVEEVGTTTDDRGNVYVALDVFATKSAPGYVAHYMDNKRVHGLASNAARALRAIPSERRAQQSRENGARPVRPGSKPRGRPSKK